MAILRKTVAPHEFSLKNDAKDPSIVLWREATAAELGAYQAARSAAVVGGGPSLSKAQAIQLATVIWDFCKSLIVGVRGCQVEDEAGQVQELSWPADKDKIIDLLPVGLVQLFKDTVLAAHFPNSVEARANAVGDEVVFPNS